MSYILSCCSTSDLNKKMYEDLGIKYLCFHYYVDGKEYLDNFGESIAFKDFYKMMADGAITKTSQISTGEYVDYFEQFLKQGLDIIHLTLSSGISGTINSCNMAKELLQEKYPERKIYVIDSLAASSGYGLLMKYLADLKNGGMDIEELKKTAENIRLNVNHWFFSTDLTYYVRGGRISKASGFFGGALHICPLLNVDNLGRLIPRKKCLGKKKVINEIVNMMIQNAQNGKDYAGDCFISHSDCLEDATKVKDLVEQNFPNLKGKVQIFEIGTTIGSHTGPGTVALFFFGNKRVN